MLRIIMNSGVIYEDDEWHFDSLMIECYQEGRLYNGLINFRKNVFINPSQISSIEIIED